MVRYQDRIQCFEKPANVHTNTTLNNNKKVWLLGRKSKEMRYGWKITTFILTLIPCWLFTLVYLKFDTQRMHSALTLCHNEKGITLAYFTVQMFSVINTNRLIIFLIYAPSALSSALERLCSGFRMLIGLFCGLSELFAEFKHLHMSFSRGAIAMGQMNIA